MLFNYMQIDKFRFGYFSINGSEYQHDIKIIDGKIKLWNYVKHHTITIEDVQELFNNVEAVVIGNGTSGLVVVEESVKKLAEEKNIKLVIRKTSEACFYFNDCIRRKKKVNAILHATC